MAQHANVSAITIGFNCWHYLEPCLASIYASTYPITEVIVVDNASADGTVERLRSEHPQVKLIQNTANFGHARAVNQGLQAAGGDYILLLDADTELAPDAIRIMMEFMTRNPHVEMVAPRTLNSDGTLQQTARNFPSAVNGLFGRRSILTRLFPDNPFARKYLTCAKYASGEPFPVEQISASCMLMNKGVVSRVGMWDENYHSYWVDTDFCKRIQEQKGLIYCVPEAVITHHEQNKPFTRKSPLRIIAFHTGALRFYRLHRTCGWKDPRCWAAFVLLTIRCGFLLLVNVFSVHDKK